MNLLWAPDSMLSSGHIPRCTGGGGSGRVWAPAAGLASGLPGVKVPCREVTSVWLRSCLHTVESRFAMTVGVQTL